MIVGPISLILWTSNRSFVGRLKTLVERCDRGCSAPVRSRIYCQSHYKAWQRKYDGDRCEWPGCSQIIAKDDWYQERHPKTGKLKKIDGRTMDTGSGRLSYCRRHEVEHLRPSPAVEELNRARLGAGLEVEGAEGVASQPQKQCRHVRPRGIER